MDGDEPYPGGNFISVQVAVHYFADGLEIIPVDLDDLCIVYVFRAEDE